MRSYEGNKTEEQVRSDVRTRFCPKYVYFVLHGVLGRPSKPESPGIALLCNTKFTHFNFFLNKNKNVTILIK